MPTQHATTFGSPTSRWRRAGLAVVVALAFVLGTSAGPRGAFAAAGGSQDCVPAESPMGSARDALQGLNRDGGLRSQQGAIDELKKCLGDAEAKAKQMLDELNNILSNLQMAQPG